MDTERKRAFIFNIVYYLILAAVFVLVVKYLLPLLTPFVVAFVIAYVLHRPIDFLSRKLKIPYKGIALLMVLAFYAIIGVLIARVSIWAFWEINALIALLPQIYAVHLEPFFLGCFDELERLVPQIDPSLVSLVQSFDDQFMGWIGSFISSLSSWAVGTASSLATSIPGLFIKLVLLIISTFFISTDYEKLTGFCLRQMSESGKNLFLQIKQYLVGTLFVCIGSYAIIVCLTFMELSIGLSFIGVEHATLIAAVIAIFDILPVLGTGGIMIPWGIFELVRGDVRLGISLLILYVIITVIRNIVEPKIVGSQLGLHPVVTLSSMFVGVQLFGVVGLFGFPIGLSLLRYLNDNGSIHIFK